MKTYNSGFTLIEVLVAVVVLAMGLLGLAALQTTGVRSTEKSYNRTQATQLAYDIIDRVRINRNAVGAYLVDAAQLKAINCPLGANGIAGECIACASAAQTCTPAQMAQKDLFDWRNNLSILPNSSASLAANGGVITVTINWNEQKEENAVPTEFKMGFRL